MKRIISIFLAIIMLAMIIPSSVMATDDAHHQYILVFQDSRIPHGTEARVEEIGGQIVKKIPQIGVMVASGGANFATQALRVPGVTDVGPNIMLSLDLPEYRVVNDFLVEDHFRDSLEDDIALNDLYVVYQWDIKRVGGDADTWAIEKGAGALVGVLDTGVYAAHPDIAPNFLYGKNFTDITAPLPDGWILWDLGDEQDYEGHGTHVAGTIAASILNGRVIGVAPEAFIANYKVMVAVLIPENGSYIATGIGYTSWILEGIVEAADDGVNVINMSLGGWADLGTSEGRASFIAYTRATQYAHTKGTLVVASSGNDGLNLDRIWPTIHVPSGLRHTISISATGPDDTLAFYSNYGREIWMTAPGGDISAPPFSYCLSAYSPLNAWAPGAGWVFSIGTSMSAPKVTGVAALIYARNPGISATRVQHLLALSAENLGSNNRLFQARRNLLFFGFGMADAYKAVTIR